MKKVILVVLMVIVFGAWVGFTLFNTGLTELQNMQFTAQDLTNKENGFYYGECNIGRWRNKVVLQIYDGEIIDIKSTKDQVIVSDETREQVFNSVLNKNPMPVDAVAGATVTSNGYLKAIIDAIEKGPEPHENSK